MNKFTNQVKPKKYLLETIVDITAILIIYHFFGFQIAVLIQMAVINVDIAFIMYKVYESIEIKEHFILDWGWVKFRDGTYHKIEVTQDGVFLDGIIVAEGKLSLIKKNAD